MRKEAKEHKHATIAYVQGYHGGNWSSQSYAHEGFRVNKYFNSDRSILCDEDGYRVDGQPMCGVGLEVETQCNTIREEAVLAEVFDKIIFQHFNDPDLWKMQSDSSLGGSTSVECITQVMTVARLRNEYQNFRLMWYYFKQFGIETDCALDHVSCGMHINLSLAMFGDSKTAQYEAIRKLFYIINRHYNLCRTLFYRPGSTNWCGQMNYANIRTVDLESFPNDHGKCINLSHINAGAASRVEIRLPGGQKSYACFRNTCESVIHLVNRCRTIKWEDCDDLVKIFKGCNQHVYDRLTLCPLSEAQLQSIKNTVKTVDFD